MEQIKIIKVTSKETKTNKPYKMCEVECGGEIRKVNIWSNAPDFANLKEGSVIMGKMTLDGQYWNISFGEAEKPRGGAFNAHKEAVIEKAVARKEASIGTFQDNKEFSIKVASTMSGAVALAVAEFKDKTVLDTLDTAVLKWRRFLWDNWDIEPKDTDPITGKLL